MIGAALGATALNTAIDYGVWSAKSNKTFKQQRQLAEEAYQRQLDLWNKQNAYNDPSQQIHRLRRAGLNPAMLNGNSVANTAGGLSSVSTPTPVSPHSSSPKVEDAVHTLSSIMVNQKQTGFIDRQTEAMAQNILNLIIERDIKEIARDLNMTEKEIRNLEYESLYEAYYGKSIYGGDPTIMNNELAERVANIRKERERMESEIGVNESETNLNIAKESETYKNVDRISQLMLNDSARLDLETARSYVENLRTMADTSYINSQTSANEFYRQYIQPLEAYIKRNERDSSSKDAKLKQVDYDSKRLDYLLRTGNARGFVSYLNFYLDSVLDALPGFTYVGKL